MSYITGKGARLRVEVAGTLAVIPQVTGITAPSQEQTTIDVTHLGSDAREFMPALQGNSNFSFSVEWDHSDSSDGAHPKILTLFGGGDSNAGALRKCAWEIAYTYYKTTTGVTEYMSLSFEGFITSINFDEVAVDSVLSATVNVQVDGPITYTATLPS